MQLHPGAIIGGKYRLERPLASGGMGAVWVARHTDLDVDVAIKFIGEAHSSSPAMRVRFVREAKASAKICSAHVVHVLDYGLENDTPFFVMELLEGEDLGVRLKREGRLPLNETARILIQIAKGLRRAHEAGFVHRDLKPSNIFLARMDDGEIVKILDFGVAKETSTPVGESTKTGEIMGSPHYMSPEQICESKNTDARSDLWSLAVILFRAITGELPFPGDACGVVMARILTAAAPMPSRFMSNLPPELDGFFRRAFQRDPDLRFQSAREMAEAFTVAAHVEQGAPSWSVVGMAKTLPQRDLVRASMPTVKVAPSSTLLAPFDLTLRSATPSSNDAPSRTVLLEPAHADAGGTLTATLSEIDLSRTKPKRRPLIVWGLGASSVMGAVVGWFLLASVFDNRAPQTSADAVQFSAAGAIPIAAQAAQPAAEEAPADPQPVNTVDGGLEEQVGAAEALGGAAPSATAAAQAPALSTAPLDTSATRANRPAAQARKRPRLGF
jgi:serine/threonine-protein kinase